MKINQLLLKHLNRARKFIKDNKLNRNILKHLVKTHYKEWTDDLDRDYRYLISDVGRYYANHEEMKKYHKEKMKEFYWKNKSYRKKQIIKCREYYQNNKQYFEEYKKLDRVKLARSEYNKKPSTKLRMRNWRKNNKEKIRQYCLKYRQKNIDKIRLNDYNKTRAKHGIAPATSVEQHLKDRRSDWYRNIVYAYLRKSQ